MAITLCSDALPLLNYTLLISETCGASLLDGLASQRYSTGFKLLALSKGTRCLEHTSRACGRQQENRVAHLGAGAVLSRELAVTQVTPGVYSRRLWVAASQLVT